MRIVDTSFWKNKRVFITGHTGFKGSWLTIWLNEMGAIIKGYSLSPNTSPNLFETTSLDKEIDSVFGDINDYKKLKLNIDNFNPEIIFHLAAQPLVRESYMDPIYTYQTNVIGTANILQASRTVNSLKAVVVVTTDKCYENKEWEWGYRENEPMGGHDPYSSSKGCAELITAAFRKSFFSQTKVAVASARAGNVIGGGDWSKDRLIPDIVNSYNRGDKVVIRNPLATRPWQHVIEPLSGYLILAENLYKKGDTFAEAFNFGPKDSDCQSVESVLNQIDKIWQNSPGWRLDENANPHEAKYLKLDISKAKHFLDWQPKWDLSEALGRVVEWNKAFKNKANMLEYCINEINSYLNE